MRSVGAALVKLIVTATSGLVSFTTNVIRPVKVTCEFSPVQEGTGDPSPDNVRPISGWTGANISTAGKNLYGGTYNTRFPLFIPRGTKVCVSGDKNLTTLNYYRADGTRISYWSTTEIVPNSTRRYRNFTVAEDVYFVMFNGGNAPNSQIAIGYDNYIYEPYQGTTLPINWQTEAGTIYGGTVTLNEDGSVDLVVTHYSNIIPPRLMGLDERTDYIGSYRNITGLGFPANVANTIICDKALLRSTQVQPTDGCAVWLYGNTYVRVWVRKDLLSTLDTAGVNEWVSNNPLRICYRRATPITYHFDNIGQLKSFLGTNNIWHNMNGDITVEYWNKQ